MNLFPKEQLIKPVTISFTK